MKFLALCAAAMLVALGLVQPDPNRKRLTAPPIVTPPAKPVAVTPPPPAPVQLNPAPVNQPAPATAAKVPMHQTDPPITNKSQAWLEEVEKALQDRPKPTNDTPASPPSPQANLEQQPPIIIKEKPATGSPLELELPNQVIKAEPELFVVKTRRLNVRIDASAKAQKIGELTQGERVAAIKSLYGNEIDGWIEITAREGALQGWVKKSLLTEQSP
jgi:Bacterial SH3 domain